MKKLVILMVLFLGSWQIFGQQKEYTIKDIVVNRWTKFYPQNIEGIKWLPNSKAYSSIEKYKKILKHDVKTAKIDTLISLDDINVALQLLGKTEINYISDYQWLSDQSIQFHNQNTFFGFDVISKTISFYVDADEASANHDFCLENKHVAYTKKNNLFISNTISMQKSFWTEKKNQITFDQDLGIVNGQTVSRNEFGIRKGTFWSPKGNFLAFYRKDECEVTDYPLVNITKRIAEVENIKYPMAGMKSEHISLGVYNLATNKTIFIENEPQSEKYLTNIAWSPDEKYIYIAVLNREQNHMKLNLYDATTGSFIKTLFEEKNDKYVEPQKPIRFMTSQANQFIWETPQVDGFNHAFLFDTNGKQIKQLTKGDWMLLEILGFDEKENFMYFTSTKESPIERHLYKLDLKKDLITKLTSEPGVHEIILSSDASYFIDNYSNTKIARKIDLIDNKGKLVRNLLTAENPVKDYKTTELTIGTLKAADGKTDLYYRLIKPADFDANKKYPCIVYVYGGPHTQLITNSFQGDADLWDFYMAQKGYVVFTVDNRGSSNRGLVFENIIHRQCGIPNVADQMEGIKFLSTLGFVNMNKIGVHGWSFGGFMTTSLMLYHPDIFKVGVAGGAVIDWKYYEVMYGERYMDMPQENPKGYEETSLLNKTKNLKGKLLEIHGFIDNTVVPQNTLDFIEKCAENNVPVDYFPYPRAEHGVRGAMQRQHLYEKITQYFDDYLKK